MVFGRFAKGRRRYPGFGQGKARSKRRQSIELGAFSMFTRALNLAPESKRGKMVFKWDDSIGDYDFSAFDSGYLTSDMKRSHLDLVSASDYCFCAFLVWEFFFDFLD